MAEAILTGRFSPAEGADGVPGPGTTLAASSSAPLVRPAVLATKPADSSVVSLPGASADSLARSNPDRTFFRSVARIGLQVAEALEYANRQGVLHRDVKPSNLLLDPKGNVWVADFGLAKAADAEDITHSGDIVGTVRYMAPERFQGKCDARSDVYALGLSLYELLALRPAFAAADRHELMHRVMSEEPERLRSLVPHLPRDLETVVHKAIDRDPVRRYPTAAALAEDLQRFLEDKPIKARRITPAEQAWRWAKRNRAVASLAAGLLLALLGGLVAVSWQWRQAVANLDAAKAANGKAHGAVRPGDGGGPCLHHRRQRGRDPQREVAGRTAEEAAGPIAAILRAAQGFAEGGDGSGVAVGPGRGGAGRGDPVRQGRCPRQGGPVAPRGPGAAPPWRGSSRAILLLGATWAAAAWHSRSCSAPSLESKRPGRNWTRRGRFSRRWPGSIPQTAAPGGWRPSVIRSTVGCSIDPATPSRGSPRSNERGCSTRA